MSRAGQWDVRLFVAVDVPAEVGDVLAELERPVVEGLRWTTREQWHVTLKFLGEVEDPAPVVAAVAAVPSVLETVEPRRARAPGDTVEASLGPVTAWFPGRRVLHVPVRGLDLLATAVTRALADVVDESGSGGPGSHDALPGFFGHLTLARQRGRRPGPARLAGVPVHAEWTVATVSLMGSALGPGGAVYEEVATSALPR